MKHIMSYKSICAAFCCQLLSATLFAQQQKVDTTHTYFIPEVTVSDIYQTREVRSTAPLQLSVAGTIQRCTEESARFAGFRRSKALCRSDRERLRWYRRTENRIHT